jgi:hypothetical protein
MNSIFTIQPGQLKTLYHTISFHKTKDKIAMVLEPLQSMIQLALLSASPIGTKMTIQENILYLQLPGITQPVSRWYNADKKDDVYFLFQVIKRFHKWYNPTISKKSPINSNTYELIKKMSLEGFDNLIKTYGSTDSNTIIQVLTMYKSLLASGNISDDKVNTDDKINLDEVFEDVITTYSANLINIIYNTLLLVEKEEDPEALMQYIDGLNLIMAKNNKQIQNWIKVNLIF